MTREKSGDGCSSHEVGVEGDRWRWQEGTDIRWIEEEEHTEEHREETKTHKCLIFTEREKKTTNLLIYMSERLSKLWDNLRQMDFDSEGDSVGQMSSGQ